MLSEKTFLNEKKAHNLPCKLSGLSLINVQYTDIFMVKKELNSFSFTIQYNFKSLTGCKRRDYIIYIIKLYEDEILMEDESKENPIYN